MSKRIQSPYQAHILNGDALLEPFKALGLEGDCFSWKEALAFGPLPDDLTLEDLLLLRAEHLSHAYHVQKSEALKTWEYQLRMLKKASEADEIVLWFEDDLFCQINLMFIINHLANSKNKTRLALVKLRIDSVYDQDSLREVLEERTLLTVREVKHFQRAYQAYTSRNPTAVENIIGTDLAVAELQYALQLHLRRFPSTQSGLGHLEQQVLRLISGGIDEFRPLFRMILELEPDYGLGDLQVWYLLKQLSSTPEPALIIQSSNGSSAMSSGDFEAATFKLTTFGEKVLAGDEDFLAKNPPGDWLGGVNLATDSVWRWDEMSHQLIRFIPA